MQTVNINNLKISLPSNENNNKGNLAAVTLTNVHYRTFDITFENIEVSDVDSYSPIPVTG